MQNIMLNAPSGYLLEEIHRKDMHIHEQQKRIDILEMELTISKQKIDELLNQLSKCSENGYKSSQGRYWSPEEHQRFLEGLKRYGSKDVKAISIYVGTRNATQVRTHAQKYFLRLEKEKNGETIADSPSDVSFNDNKEKDELDENDVQEDSSDKDPNPNNDNNNTVAPEPSNESPISTPPSIHVKAARKPITKTKTTTPKKKGPTKRKLTTMALTMDSNLISIKPESNSNTNRIPSSAPLTSFLPQYTMMSMNQANMSLNIGLCNKIIAETSETVLYNMKNWSSQDYALFVEGLISVQEEKDNTSKCITIRDRYLPHQSLDDVVKCYSLLQNVAMKESSYGYPIPFFSMNQTSMSSSDNMMNLNLMENDAKRMRMMSSPIPSSDMSHFSPISFGGNMNDSAALRYQYGNPYQMNNSVRYSNPGSYNSYQTPSDNGFFPAFPTSIESNQIVNSRSNQGMDLLSRINPSGDHEFDPSIYQ